MARTSAESLSGATDSSVPTQASSVYDRLYADILTGELTPGKKLRLKELIERYESGNTPLREALNRLSTKGMVVREENRGFRVSLATKDELIELTKTRCWLEEIGLRESIANGGTDWEERIVLAFHRLKRAASQDGGEDNKTHSNQAWETQHQDFHLALISGCRSEMLLKYCAELQQRSLRYRNLTEVVEYRGMHELDEHQALQDAVMKRDADLAVDLLCEHYNVTFRILIESERFD